MKPALVILAAGESRRLGRCKATIELAGTSALERLLAAGAVLDDGPALVVSGAHDAEIRAAAPSSAEVLFNAAWRSGRTSGVIAARSARPGRDLCIAPVDVPLVPPEVFAALLEAWFHHASPPRGWLAPVHAGTRGAGHPIVVGRELLELLRVDQPDRPLRALREDAEPLLSVAVESHAILDDLDTPADLRRLRRRLA